MNSSIDYPDRERHPVVIQVPKSSGLVNTEPFPTLSHEFYNYSYNIRQIPAPENSFVSPVTYDPVSGLYIQTFPEEHVEFVHKYGQRIDIPEPSGWSYYDSQFPMAQPSGFYYNNGTYQPAAAEPMDVPVALSESDEDAKSMLQYMASPPSVPAQTHHQYVNNTMASCAPCNGAPATPNTSDYPKHVKHEPSTPNLMVEEEELLQPHMIVPSQHALGGFMEELRRRELPVEIQTHRSSTGPLMNHSPFQGPLTSSSATTSPASSPTESRQGQPWGTQMPNSQPSGYPAHDLHSVAPEALSPPVSSPESDGCHSPSHTHTHSPKTKLRAISRGWSPHRRSPTPRASSQGMRLSPLPQNRKSSTDADKKPVLACLFCRGRKIACGPALPGSINQSCNQCARRDLKCEYPTESRRGMRKRHKNPDKVKPVKTNTKGPRKRATY
ncbi:hypothetical protein PILCRDRAFT_823959 [Piloderma croceum F 1598]|uniref:Zn(2)-C6 fungal-type domain-containing protein n=1 Tax=Piloderma croceum (strain F 1598) TaxID=765440 RepID=A0A0C3AXW5_PILCF|nr:hypothetical protein PILCRDRAFT_823959 [Piloderma croceum F 1598]